jgi:non-ribosomal peptide synthetase component E (peptide arylation enzyme)
MAGARFPIEGVTYVDAANSARYRAAGALVESNAGDVLRSAAERVPNKWALISQERRLTYAEFDEASERLGAALLALGLAPGDRALFQMGTVVESAVALFACFKAGLIPVCSLPQYREIEMGELARRSEAKVWLVQADFSAFDLAGWAVKVAGGLPLIRHIVVARGTPPNGTLSFDGLIDSQSLQTAQQKLSGVSVDIEDVLTFQLSGGTTGVPKIIPRFHGEYMGQARDWARRNGMGTNLVMIYALPLIHNAGQVTALFPTVLLGGSLVLMPRMDAKTFFGWVECERATHSLNIGPATAQILDYSDAARHDLSSIRLLTCFNRAEVIERHLKVPCGNIFGITEGFCTCSAPDWSTAARFGTVGAPVSEHDEIRLLEPGTERDVPFGQLGELCFRGPSTTRGYFRMPEVNQTSFTSDGFFRTGDIAKAHQIEARICYSFEGRLKDNIDRGGEKFGADEVENLIACHPDVADVKVVAMPDRIFGEKACAYLIMRPGKALLSVRHVGEFLIAQGLAKFKLPERIEGIDAFPVTRVGKVDKAVLRKWIAEKLAQEQADSAASSQSPSAEIA